MTDELETQETIEEPVVTEPSGFDVNGRRLTAQQLDPYIRFMDWAKTNPQGFDDLAAWERGEKVLVTPEQLQPQTPPNDFEDEFIPQALKEKIASIETFQKEWYGEREAEKKAAIDAGMDQFTKENKDLTQDELEEVLRTARDHEMIRIELTRNPHDKVAAVRNALKKSLLLSFPDKEKQRAADQVVTDLAAKRKAAAATGGSASVPRVEPEPEDPQKALIEDLRAAMNEAH